MLRAARLHLRDDRYDRHSFANAAARPSEVTLGFHLTSDDERGMETAVAAFGTVDELAAHVHDVLCAKDSLDPRQAPLFRTPLVKRGRPCGLVFHVEGPRLLRTSAIWSSDADRILFYDSTGTRFHTIELSDGPEPVKLAA